jgi:NADH dehydrogenase
LIPLPLFFAKLSAIFLERLPKPLITTDQLKLLKYDNITSKKYKTNFDIGVPSTLYFEEEVKKYCHMWKVGGEFSTKKYQSNLKNK